LEYREEACALVSFILNWIKPWQNIPGPTLGFPREEALTTVISLSSFLPKVFSSEFMAFSALFERGVLFVEDPAAITTTKKIRISQALKNDRILLRNLLTNFL